jgi:hypothetical protein
MQDRLLRRAHHRIVAGGRSRVRIAVPRGNELDVTWTRMRCPGRKTLLVAHRSMGNSYGRLGSRAPPRKATPLRGSDQVTNGTIARSAGGSWIARRPLGEAKVRSAVHADLAIGVWQCGCPGDGVDAIFGLRLERHEGALGGEAAARVLDGDGVPAPRSLHTVTEGGVVAMPSRYFRLN